MPLEDKTRLGNYEIQGILGAGGMGEVYRAHDTKLARDVAIKVLPRKFAEDQEALQRFEREAKAVAALAHPNIVAIYDFGSVDDTPYAVMELLQGKTLREHLHDGALPPRKACSLARQIAEGLGAAHDKGIVHRDLKPDNVFISADGRPKILDFGLAADHLPTAMIDGGDETTGLTAGKTLTGPGTVLGTVGYMAPEQIRAEAVDHRTDIFAFGCLLYEMLGGRRAFKRDTAVETMTAVLREDPESLDSSSNISPALDRVVRRCLEKNPEERFQSTRDLAFAIDNAASVSDSGVFSSTGVEAGGSSVHGATTDRSASGAQRKTSWPLVIFATIVGLIAGFLLFRGDGAQPTLPEPPRIRTLTVSGRDVEPSASPDGRVVAFRSERDGRSRIWLKQLIGGGEEPLTNGPDERPQFSPDGSALLFIREESNVRSVYRQSLLGGQVRKLIDDVAEAVWSPGGDKIAFIRVTGLAGERTSLIGVADADGGNPTVVYEAQKSLSGINWSPDSGHIVAVQTSITGNSPDNTLVILDTATNEVRLTDATEGAGVPTSGLTWTADGDLVLAIASAVVGDQGDTSSRFVRFNLDTGTTTTLFWAQHLFPLQGLRVDATIADIVASETLVYHATSVRQELKEFVLDTSGAPRTARILTRSDGRDRQPAYSPDAGSIVFSSNRTGNLDLWKMDLHSNQLQQITDDGAQDWDPGFSHDGQQIVWSSDRGGHLEIWIADVDGSGARQLTDDGVDAENPTFTPDGEWVVYWSSNPEKLGIWKIRSDGSDAQQLTAGAYLQPEVSPDGKYVAFLFLEFDKLRTIIHVLELATGTVLPFQVEVPAPSSGTNIILGRVRWLHDGSGLAYVGLDEDEISGIYAQDFSPNQDTRHTKRQLAGFSREYVSESFDISPDGSRLILSTLERTSNLMLVDGLKGVEPPR